ncbi:hypothetical protein PMAC_001495 [Pneumocystis sp. 'macacae']|nr:hypothetical protein PMAC_001495 [Pneumocystis sp. 'macacae']
MVRQYKNLLYQYFLDKKYFSNHSKLSILAKCGRKNNGQVKEYIYGRAPVFAALSANNREKFYKLYVYGNKKDDILKMSESLCIPVEYVENKGILNNYSSNRPHNGFVLEASPMQCFSLSTHKEFLNFQADYLNNNGFKISDNLHYKNYINLWLFLDEITDPMNMGAIMRNAYYFGLNGVILSAKNW